MPIFDLSFRTDADGEPASMAIEAADETRAREAASIAIADFLGRPHAFVEFEAGGRFTAGAGFWSRRGVYTLIAQPAPTKPRR